jgi:hypothetical protein
MDAHSFSKQTRFACVLALAVLLVAACSTVDLGETPVAPASCNPSQSYFDSVIWPEYIAPDSPRSCVDAPGCHRSSDGFSALQFTVDPVDDAANYEVATHFLNCGNFIASPLLTKPLEGIDAHGGKELFGANDPEYVVFTDWFAAD